MFSYQDFINFCYQRRTPRLVDRNDIPLKDIEKIAEAIKLAPSFCTLVPYLTYFLTNSPQGIAKKEQIVEYSRCLHADGTTPNFGDSWNDREMPQPLLSGLTIVFIAVDRPFKWNKTGPNERRIQAHRDISIAATYTMFAARSLGYQSGIFGAFRDRDKVAQLFTPERDAAISLTVTVANAIIPQTDLTKERQYFDYKGIKPFAYPKKRLYHPPRPLASESLFFI